MINEQATVIAVSCDGGHRFSKPQTQEILLGTGDFARFLTDDVTWTTMETGAQVRSPRAVQDAVIGLHARMSDFETRQLVVSDDFACIEGSCLPKVGPPGRISYCVTYDLRGDQIASMRAHGPLTAMTPVLAAE